MIAFKEFPAHIPGTYVVVHTTGFGDQGGEPIRYHEARYSSDDEQEAIERGKELYPPDPSGWTYDNYSIFINTSTSKGKELKEKWVKETSELFARMEKDKKLHPEKYHTYKINGIEITLVHNEAFDGPLKPNQNDNSI